MPFSCSNSSLVVSSKYYDKVDYLPEDLNTNIPYSYLGHFNPNSTFFFRNCPEAFWISYIGWATKIMQFYCQGIQKPKASKAGSYGIPITTQHILNVSFDLLCKSQKRLLIFYGFMNKTSAFNILTFLNIVANIADT